MHQRARKAYRKSDQTEQKFWASPPDQDGRNVQASTSGCSQCDEICVATTADGSVCDSMYLCYAETCWCLPCTRSC